MNANWFGQRAAQAGVLVALSYDASGGLLITASNSRGREFTTCYTAGGVRGFETAVAGAICFVLADWEKSPASRHRPARWRRRQRRRRAWQERKRQFQKPTEGVTDMLVLSRAMDEELVIDTTDGRVTVTVTAIQGGRVKLGIAAPRQCAVNRREVADAISRGTPRRERRP